MVDIPIGRFQHWLPASWLHVGLGMGRVWANLGSGDRLFIVILAFFSTALLVRLAVSIGAYLAQAAPAALAISLGGFAFAIVALALSFPLASVRRGQLFQFIGETSARKRQRIGFEFVGTGLISAILVLAMWPFLSKAVAIPAFIHAMLWSTLGHGLVHVIQFLRTDLSPSRMNPTGLTGLAQRSCFAPLIGGSVLSKLHPTSSRFLLKANTNPLIWLLVVLTILASGGAAISLKSPLLLLSTISTVLMIVQLTQSEPRVGNGRTIGACAKRMPIQRAISDLIALSLPHFACALLAVPLIILEAKGLAIGILLTQLVATIWILWMTLVVQALPPMVFLKSARWLVGFAIIASQIMPPLIIVLLVIATFLSTRDLIRLAPKGPAQWPI